MASATLVLVDGTAVLYRSFYAIRDLATKAGRPTNAVFGFIRALRQLRQQWGPTHWMVAFDGGLPEERLAMMRTYKAQRPPMPPALREQLEPAQQYLDGAGVAWLRMDRQEADDVLASVVQWARPDAGRILLATSDKDMYQLVDEKVSVVSPFGKGEILDSQGVREKTGVPPDRIVEWLALTGDSSDNIPGVPGVGPKTAAALLSEYGSLAGLWAGAGGVRNEKLRVALAGGREAAERNAAMVKLRSDLECGVTWGQLAVRAPDHRRLARLFTELEFESLLRELREPGLFDGQPGGG
jgi:DNA polymerase-1